MTQLSVSGFRSIAEQACHRCGASPEVARSLVDATLSADRAGRKEVGVSHFLDYLKAFRDGRIDGAAVPEITDPFPAFIDSDARGGIAQLGFDTAFDELCRRAKTYGIAIFTQRNSYPAGEIGYYVRRLAERGLMGVAAANANAVMATAVGGARVYATNPMAFGAPLPPPHNHLVIDQASSATAFVNIVRAAEEGRDIPEGWALDSARAPTVDPAKAMVGALLPFGGYKGANIALMVEVLSAGLSGASWSLDAADFRSGDRCPGIGLTVIALSARDAGFERRLSEQVDRLRSLGVVIPGAASPRGAYAADDLLEMDAALMTGIQRS